MKIQFPKGAVEIDLAFADLVKLDDADPGLEPYNDDPSNATPPVADPVLHLVQKAQRDHADKQGATTPAGDFDLLKRLSETDSRDHQQSNVSLSKSGLPDWSWSSPVSADTSLSKRATQGTKARFERQLAEFFRGHDEELAEARRIVDEALAAEREEMADQAA